MKPSIKVTDCNLVSITNTFNAGGLQTEKEKNISILLFCGW
jgi:hypothetical protein